MLYRDHEQLAFCSDKASGLKAIIGIHDTTLGPALGGTRMWNYESEEDAIRDVLRLSRGMTHKAAVAGLNLGGGKAVIIGDPRRKNEALFRAFGRFVHSLNGRYITAEDVNTSVQDMEWVRMETNHVTGISRALGGSGDPSPMTAWGVYVGMKASTQWVYGTKDLSKFTVAVQGLGHTGHWLCSYLHAEGVKMIVTDIDEERVARAVEEFGATAVAPDEITKVDAEIFSPAALGGVVDDAFLDHSKFKIIAGAANNQLKDEDRQGPLLREKGILYAPDFVINSGGLMNVANELEGYNQERAKQQIETIDGILTRIYETTKEQDIPTYEAANRLARERIKEVAHLKRFWLGKEGGSKITA
jgi:leucine dehydrogenase